MAKPFQPTPHPLLSLPDAAAALQMGERAWAQAMHRREQIIRAERNDPFGHCWEPPIWKVADALMGFPWVDADWARRMREHLGFERPAQAMLVMGGNRGGKSQWAAHRVMRILRLLRTPGRNVRAWALHSTLPMSRQYQQPLFFEFLPENLRGKSIKEQTTYIAYKQKTGFSEEALVLPPMEGCNRGNDLSFKTYDQDRNSIEGGNVDVIWNDELVPSDWVETEEFRVAERAGWILTTFTPVAGYSETVKMFADGAEVVRESTAFLLPKDGGEPDVARALGYEDPAIIAELEAAAREKRAALHPQCVPEKCEEWLDGKTGQPEVPAGREFERVPRILKCVSGQMQRAVIFFHSSDNPYGNPKGIWSTVRGKPAAFIKERFYGVAHKTQSARFPKFDPKVHVVDPDEVPPQGTNYLYVDPTSGRNFFMTWFRVTPERVYIYREWPGNYYIRGQGVPGPWALPDGKKADGRPGPAQNTFGWGYRDYKRQIAELEGWKDALKEKPENLSEEEWIDAWDENNGAREVVQERKVDSRFASAPKMENDRPTTLITDFEDILIFFAPTPGGPITEGVQKLNDLLAYDESKPVDFFNQPKMLVSRDCPNTIFALQTWTGRDGEKGACKDPIDNPRYFATDDCAYLGDGQAVEEAEEGSDFETPARNYY